MMNAPDSVDETAGHRTLQPLRGACQAARFQQPWAWLGTHCRFSALFSRPVVIWRNPSCCCFPNEVSGRAERFRPEAAGGRFVP
jgi:hypothetical protein